MYLISEGRYKAGSNVVLWKEIRKEGPLLSHKIIFFIGNGRRMNTIQYTFINKELIEEKHLCIFSLINMCFYTLRELDTI